ncbi:MAG: hypothetical protein M1497_14720 [Nitrospirae bacterium]|nr:hypothetical protein [Nitrospirota bacterium]
METETIVSESGISLLIEKQRTADAVEVAIRIGEAGKCLLHWGVRRERRGPWLMPPESFWPGGSHGFDHAAVRTPFVKQDGHGEILIRFDGSAGFSSIDFVLFFPDEGRWDNNHGKNYRIEIPGREAQALPGSPALARVAEAIIEQEMGRNSWTLMHRINLCYELLDEIDRGELEGLALLFVWMRFSALRQLDWQRNYNTQPRELGHALDRLSVKLAGRFLDEPGERELLRLIMTTLGRGSDAQRVRDEVLNIMHRRNIKEVSGHFMEEWHQKLHNNATPDDIVICEAYLEFLRSGGDLDRFYRKLEEGGISKERLENYERPIRSHPDFIPHLKDALISDFEHFLGILKEVHSATDLGTAIHLARYLFDGELHGMMDFLWSRRDDRTIPVSVLVGKITEARRRLTAQFQGRLEKVRDLLYLDLALEDFLRVAVERNLDSRLDPDQLADLTGMVLENLSLAGTDGEFLNCLRHWERLAKPDRFTREWSLRAKAVLDRLTRALGAVIDRYHSLLQPRAEFLGSAFHAQNWTISLFTEEVVRGRPFFALSVLLRLLDPLLRKSASLGNWQVISRGEAVGEIEVAATLKSIEGKNFARPVIVIADRVAGNEEIPQGVDGIVTPSVTDVLSHIAVRARNAGILFATCYDSDELDHLRSLRGHALKAAVGRTGEVAFEESRYSGAPAAPRAPVVRARPPRPDFTAYVLPMDDFTEQSVGGKSYNLKRLQGRLPEWIRIPPSVALPFGVFEKVLSEDFNSGPAGEYEELAQRVDSADEEARPKLLGELRGVVLKLKAPEGLPSSLRAVMDRAGLQWPDWDGAWTCIRQVWASQWNDRAYLSRKANGIPHEDLYMAVLIQKVVEAQYSYVIHTVNPFSGDREEIYAEAVLGLGEALVGNYPGRALSFSCGKDDHEPVLLSFPSKSEGLFGGGLIFRSDSNGEDLAGYAGAGLYDSFMLPLPSKRSLDYTEDPLVWDEGFRRDFLRAVAIIGAEVEKALASPQDIEGAYAKGEYHVVQSRHQVGTENG